MSTTHWRATLEQVLSEGVEAEVNDQKTRFVLWQDPELHVFNEPEPEKKESKDNKPPSPPSPNQPSERLEAAFSPDGASMVLVRSNEESGSDMYLSTWSGRAWSLPLPLESLNTNSNERGPAYSRDGRHLFFSSDRDGGRGGLRQRGVKGHDGGAPGRSGRAWRGLRRRSRPPRPRALRRSEARLFLLANHPASLLLFLEGKSLTLGHLRFLAPLKGQASGLVLFGRRHEQLRLF